MGPIQRTLYTPIMDLDGAKKLKERDQNIESTFAPLIPKKFQ
jgi:hypothetical protein